MERRGQVERQDRVPLVDGKLVDRRDELDAGVVDQHVDGAELRERLAHHRFDRVLLRQVGAIVADRGAVLVLDLRAQRLDLRGVAEAVENHVRALPREGAGDGQADAARRSGHQSSLALQHCEPRSKGWGNVPIVRGGGANLRGSCEIRCRVRNADAWRDHWRRRDGGRGSATPAPTDGRRGGGGVKTIAIVGGGFAGTTLLRALDGRLPAGHELLLISEESYTTFNPMLPEAVGASVFPEQVVAPIRQIARSARFVMGRVTAVDPAARTLRCSTLAGERMQPYEQLLLAFGNRARLDLLPGLQEHGIALKTVGDAMHIRNVVLRRVARIELESDPAVRARLGHFVVIGGGFSGVETAGELVDCLRAHPPLLPARGRARTAGHAAARPGAPAAGTVGTARPRRACVAGRPRRAGARRREGPLRRRARRAAGRRRIPAGGQRDLHRRHPAQRAGRAHGAAHAARAHRREPGPVGGARARRLGGRRLRAGARTRTTARSRRRRRSSRCARRAAPRATCSRRSPARPRAPFAIGPAARWRRSGTARASPTCSALPLWGLPAWLLWRAYYLAQMPTFGRKVRIFVEWTWGMFFPNDITHLRFARSQELEDHAALEPGGVATAWRPDMGIFAPLPHRCSDDSVRSNA